MLRGDKSALVYWQRGGSGNDFPRKGDRAILQEDWRERRRQERKRRKVAVGNRVRNERHSESDRQALDGGQLRKDQMGVEVPGDDNFDGWHDDVDRVFWSRPEQGRNAERRSDRSRESIEQRTLGHRVSGEKQLEWAGQNDTRGTGNLVLLKVVLDVHNRDVIVTLV